MYNSDFQDWLVPNAPLGVANASIGWCDGNMGEKLGRRGELWRYPIFWPIAAIAWHQYLAGQIKAL